MRHLILLALLAASLAGCRNSEPPTTPGGPSFLQAASNGLVVNSLADPGADGLCDAGECTLREAIAAANADPDPNDITFALGGVITLSGASGQLTIGTDITITGTTGATGIVIERSAGDPVEFRILEIQPGATVELANLTMRGGKTSGPDLTNGGAGIFNNGGTLTLVNTTVTRNSAFNIGGIWNSHSGTLTLDHSIVSDNSAEAIGGINAFGATTISHSTISGNSAANCGGIRIGLGGVTLESSTVSGNSAREEGAGICMESNGSLTIRNSTISGNSATRIGGGISYRAGVMTLQNTTIVGNSAGLRGGGIIQQFSDNNLTIINTLVAGNTAALTADDTDGPDIWFEFPPLSVRFSLIGKAGGNGLMNGVDGNLVGVAPLVGPLENNGGPTETHALLAGSPAIDAGQSAMPPCLATDQVGTPRPQGGGCDIGAFEFISSLFPSFSGFLPPVQSPPALNTAKAGQTVKVKFSLGGNQGLTILAANSPASQPVDCATLIPLGAEAVTLPPGGSGLTYDGAMDRYSYGWKTERGWGTPTSCRQLVLRLSDGTTYRAYFQFTK